VADLSASRRIASVVRQRRNLYDRQRDRFRAFDISTLHGRSDLRLRRENRGRKRTSDLQVYNVGKGACLVEKNTMITFIFVVVVLLGSLALILFSRPLPELTKCDYCDNFVEVWYSHDKLPNMRYCKDCIIKAEKDIERCESCSNVF
jgi:hypothetical protein